MSKPFSILAVLVIFVVIAIAVISIMSGFHTLLSMIKLPI